MTAQEKTEKLSYYYWNLLEPFIKNEEDRGKVSIKCAIINVDEILNLDKQDVYMDYTWWREVKQCLEKLNSNKNENEKS